ncbi:MAG: hypothetical protein ACI9TY_001007 [Alphaproteobacteria bacterium]|jgi:hypothetical protein
MPILLIPHTKNQEEAYAIGRRIHIMQNHGLEFSNIITAATRQHINTAITATHYFADRGLQVLSVNSDKSLDEQKDGENIERAYKRCAKGAFADVEIFKDRGLKGIVIFIATKTLLQSLDHALNNTPIEDVRSRSSLWQTGTPYLFSDEQEAFFKNALADMEKQGFFTGY